MTGVDLKIVRLLFGWLCWCGGPNRIKRRKASMDGMMKRKGKRGVISKTWERIKKKRVEEVEKEKGKGRVAPQGCFSVYVGPQKQKFVIKTEHANHPLFKMLLVEAESEYGYNSQEPLTLPCDVDIFYKVLMQMDQDDQPPPLLLASSSASGVMALITFLAPPPPPPPPPLQCSINFVSAFYSQLSHSYVCNLQ